jgi:hypothetical protein
VKKQARLDKDVGMCKAETGQDPEKLQTAIGGEIKRISVTSPAKEISNRSIAEEMTITVSTASYVRSLPAISLKVCL